MALMLPSALEWVLEMCGFDWPTGDEDKMMECANTWRQFAADVEALQSRGLSAAGNVLADNSGDSIDGFSKTWEKFSGGSGYFDDAREGAELIAVCMDAAAMLIIALKVAVIAQLVILAVEIIAAQAAAPFTLGLSELGAMGAAAATRMILRKLLKEIAKQILDAVLETAKEPFVSALEAMVSDIVAQTVEQNFGKQSGYDLGRTAKTGYEEGKNALKESGSTFGNALRDGAGSRAGHGARNGLTNSGHDGGDGGHDSSDSGNDSSSRSDDSSSDTNSSPDSSRSTDGSPGSDNAPDSSPSPSGESSSPSDSPASAHSPGPGNGDSGRRAPDIGTSSSSSPSSGPDTSSPSSPSSSDGPSDPGSPSPSRGSDSPSPFDVGTQAYHDSIGHAPGDGSPTPDASPDPSTPPTGTRPDSDGGPAPDTTPDSARPSRPEGVAPDAPEHSASIPDPRHTEPASMPSPPPQTDHPDAAPTPAPDTSRPEPAVHQVDHDSVTTMPAPAQGPTPDGSHDGNTDGSQNQGSGRAAMPSGAMPGNTPTAHPSPGQAPAPSRPAPHHPDDTGVTLMSDTTTVAPPAHGTQPGEAGAPQHAAPSSATPAASPPGAVPPPTVGPIPTQAPAAGTSGTTPRATTPRTEQPSTRPTTPSRDTQRNRPGAQPRTETPGRPTTPPRTDAPRADAPRTETPARPTTPPRGEQPTNRPAGPRTPTEPPASPPDDQGMPAPHDQQPDHQQPDADHQTPDQHQPPTDGSTPVHPTAPPPAPQADSLSDIRHDLNIPSEGLTTPDPVHQQDLENAHPRNPDGTPQVYADPRQGNWAGLQNDGGPGVPGRSNNCADCTRSFLETWFGRPTVSAPRTLDLNPDGSLNRYSAEHDSVENQARWAGAPSTYAGKDHPNPYARIAHELSQAGHGSAAVIGVNWPGGGGHAFAAVNHNGTVLFVDAQTGVVSENPIHLGAQEVFYTPLDAHRNPITPYFLTPSTPQPSTQHTPDTDNSSGADSSADPSTTPTPSEGPSRTSPSAGPATEPSTRQPTDETPSPDGSAAEQNTNTPSTDTAPPSTPPDPDVTSPRTPEAGEHDGRPMSDPQNTQDTPDTRDTPNTTPDSRNAENDRDGQDTRNDRGAQDSQDTRNNQDTHESGKVHESDSDKAHESDGSDGSPEAHDPQDSDHSQDSDPSHDSDGSRDDTDAQDSPDTGHEPESREPVFPATDTRPYGPPDGYDRPGDEDARVQQERFPRNEDGSFQQAPDPREGTWVDDIRGRHPDESGRDVNCPDGVLAFADAYAGNPTVAARRSRNEDGTPADTPEPNGRDRIERALGSEFHDFGDGRDAYRNLETTLLDEGHGSQAVIITQNADGRAHAWNVVNHDGRIVYADPQTGQRSTTPLHNGDHGVFAIPLDANRRPVDTTTPPATHTQSPATPQSPAGSPSASHDPSAEATREQRNQSLPDPEKATQKHANVPPDSSQQALRLPEERNVHRIALDPVQAQMREWATAHPPASSPLGDLLRESLDRRQDYVESAQHVRGTKHALDDARKQVRDAITERKKAVKAEKDATTDAEKQAAQERRAAAEQRLTDARAAVPAATAAHKEAQQSHQNIQVPKTNFTDSDLRRHLDPAWSNMNDGQRYAVLATLGRMSHSFHANNAVGMAPGSAKDNSPYADAPPKRGNKPDPAAEHPESVAPWRRESSAYSKAENLQNPENLRKLLEDIERNSSDSSDKNYAVVEVVDDKGESHYIIDSSVPPSVDGVRPRHSESHILEWIEQHNKNREAEGKSKYSIAGLYTEREPCGSRKGNSGHADCSTTIRQSEAMQGTPVYYSTTYRVDPDRKELLEKERERLEKAGESEAEIKKKIKEFRTPNQQIMDKEIQGHLDFVRELSQQLANPSQNPPSAPAPDSHTPPTQAPQSGPSHPTDAHRTPPSDPAGTDRRPPADPAGTSHRHPTDPAATDRRHPTDPADTHHTRPTDPAATDRRYPTDPADTHHTRPTDPANADHRAPANPAGTNHRRPADSTASPATTPTKGGRTPSADPAGAGPPTHNGTVGHTTAGNGTSVPTDAHRSHRDVSQPETETASARETPRPTAAATGAGERSTAPHPSTDEPREGSPAADNQSEKRGGLKRLWQSWTHSEPAGPTEITTEVDQPRFGNHKKLPELQPDRYGTPLDRPDGTRVPLFEGPPSREQTQQGAIGDCGIIATMGAVASRYPDLLQDMIRETEDGNYEVRFHEVARNRYGNHAPTGRILTVRVTPEVPVYSDMPSFTVYANANDVGVAWPAIMEKAIAGLDQFWDDKKRDHESQFPQKKDFDGNLLTGYSRIGQGSTSGTRAELLAQLTGRTSENHDFPTQFDAQGRSPEKQLLAHLRELTESGRPVVIGTQPRGTGVENKMEKNLLSSHAYEIVSVDDKNRIQLRNPHNSKHPEPLTIKEFMKYCRNQYASLEDEK
ncbi:toxin glutamine deamidase domain-containing protein [Streptomyces sp. NPDC014733]|uniref:toxin glutamine deamidase domain-containing protein n=1 Tax=Streptomyces sp. NPDC014733 TaxID=3364885 RepID=UPI0037021FD6